MAKTLSPNQRKRKMRDLDGKRFGMLVATNDLERRGSQTYRLCICDCGKSCQIPTTRLISGHTKSCGCYRVLYAGIHGPNNKKDLTGQVFGRLTVLEESDKRSTSGDLFWKCLCECGAEALVPTNSLKRKTTTSCGCFAREVAKKLAKERVGIKNHSWNPNLTQEHRERGRNFPEYFLWRLEVYNRDEFICQACFRKGGDIVAHHIKNYSDNKELRVDINNGCTLCHRCHTLFHKIYGSKNNSLEQLKEFQGIYHVN